MAQSKSNQLGSYPSFTTKTTTPAMSFTPAPMSVRPKLDLKGTVNRYVTQDYGQSRVPTPQPPDTQSDTQSPSFPATGNTTQTQLDSIRQQALGLQGQLQSGQVSELSPAPTPQQEPFAGILTSLRGASDPTREQERTRREMERIAAGNQAIGDNARATSEKYGSEIARIGQLTAGAVAGNLSTGTNVVGSGNAAIASQSGSQRMSALAQGLDAELKGSAQQLTGQEQQAQAFNPSLQASLTQQQQQIQGLSSAGGLAQPMAVPYSSGLFNPTSGQQAGGGFGGWAGYTSAQQAQSLMEQYPDARVQYNSQLSPEQNLQMIQQALSGSPSYQKSTYGVPGQQSYFGATMQQTAQQGFQQSYQAYQDIQKQKTYADNISNQLSGVMSQYGIGENDVRKVNEIQNFLGRQFGEEGQAAFQTALTEAQRAYSTLLTIGGGTVPTEATAASNAILNPNSTISQINAAIKQLKIAGEERLRTQGTQANTYFQQLQSGSQQSGYGGGGGSFAEQW